MARPPARKPSAAPQPVAAPRRPPRRRAPPAPAPSQAEPDRPLAAGLLAASQAAASALAQPDPAAAVHALRRALKQARALLRLVSGAGRPAACDLRRELAEAARSLAAARDTQILDGALADLSAHAGDNPVPSAARRALAGPAGRSAETDAVPALAMLAEANLPGRIAEAARTLADLTPADLPAALAAGYARARRAGRGIEPDDAHALHELRKHVVVHLYQMHLVAPWWRRLGRFWLGELDRLREALGKHHDLEILLAHLDEAQSSAGTGEKGKRRGLAPEAAAAAMTAAHHRQRKLGAKALRRHARLFAERPKAFRRRLAAYLDSGC